MPVMLPDPDTAWRALLQRDARLDGRLYVGVTSTGIYCRPICRVRTPRRENCRFFETAAQAEAARFRPCLKCRPELAPGDTLRWSVMDAPSTLARQAAEALDRLAFDSATNTPPMAALAERLGITDRHLRRIFLAEHGVTPLQHLQTRRLLMAKQLLTDSRLTITAVALACGFRSLRRFNAAFLERYGMPPSRLRSGAKALSSQGASAGRAAHAGPDPTSSKPSDITAPVDLRLDYRPPYDVPGLLRFLQARAVPGVEWVDVEAAVVRRSLRGGLVQAPGRHGLDQAPAGWLEVRFEPDRHRVHLRLAPALAPWTVHLVACTRRWLDLDADPAAIAASLPALACANGDGLRLPGATDGFEIGVRAVLGQRVTVAAARTLASRLVQRWGQPLETPWAEVDRGFPTPEALGLADPQEMGRLGLLRRQVQAIQALAVEEPRLQDLEHDELPLPARAARFVEALQALPGIGPWTAHYLTMRRLGWRDAFPPGDVAVLNALGLGRDAASARQAQTLAEAWRPWRSYAVLRLWQTLETTTT